VSKVEKYKLLSLAEALSSQRIKPFEARNTPPFFFIQSFSAVLCDSSESAQADERA